MLVQIDFYRSSGKWYIGGRVEIKSMPWESGVLENIIEKQNILKEDWYESNDFYLVIDDIPKSKTDPNYRYTYSRLYTPSQISETMDIIVKIDNPPNEEK